MRCKTRKTSSNETLFLDAADKHAAVRGGSFFGLGEEFARDMGFGVIVLHARESAVGFYETLGYRKCGARFWEVGLPHWEMTKALDPDNSSVPSV